MSHEVPPPPVCFCVDEARGFALEILQQYEGVQKEKGGFQYWKGPILLWEKAAKGDAKW